MPRILVKRAAAGKVGEKGRILLFLKKKKQKDFFLF